MWLTRRKFSALVAVAVVTLSVSASSSSSSPHSDRHPRPDTQPCPLSNPSALAASQVLLNPYDDFFPDNNLTGTSRLFPMPACHGFAIEEAGIDELQSAMASGRLTAVELATCYLERLRQVDQYAHALLEANPSYLDIARTLDAERRRGAVRSPLHGIPFLVKDNIATKDGMQTTAGSWALLGSVVPRDAFVVERMREAGALLLGHATLSEWADMRSSNYSEGYGARSGQCRSAYNLTQNPGGSSSGSAVAVSLNGIPVALGTETDGSVINPAERNAIVGIKPSVGLTSRAGVIPESQHQDTVGTFGKTVRDAVYVLDAIYGVDERDNYTLAQRGRTPNGGYAQFLTDRHALKDATFGIPWESFWTFADTEQQAALLDIINLIRDAGATIVNGTEIPSHETIIAQNGWDWDWGATRGRPNESEFTVVKVDFYNNIRAYLSELGNTDIRSLEDIVRYNYANDGTEGGYPYPRGVPAFYSGQDSFLASLETGGVRDETYWQALEFVQRVTGPEGIDAALRHRGRKLDGLLVPPDVGQTYQVAAQCGYPMITIPAAVHSATSMPFGLAIMDGKWHEAQLVRWASAIEDLLSQGEGSGAKYGRTQPTWAEYMTRNIPVLNA